MKFFKEFKEFISRGSVMDLAVGVIIGAAFTAIINALVTNIISPLLGAIIDTENLAAEYVMIGSAKVEYGAFLSAVINFVLIALVIFLVVKAINSMRPQKKEPAAEVFHCPYCKMEVDKDATRCPYCTSEIVREPEPEPEPAPAAEANPRPARMRRKI